MSSESSEVVIDVLSPDSFSGEHLPGAVNFCVYETAFVDKVKESFPDKGVAITVYGQSDETREAEVAAERLREAGYGKVNVLKGGLEGWKAGGGTAECGKDVKEPVSGRQVIDTEASFIRWTGRNLFNFHTGAMRLADGSVELERGKLVAAEIGVDMGSLSCSDLTDSAMNAMLIGHLRSGDFFEVDRYPTAKFTLVSAEAIEGATAGTPNYRIAGKLDLRGVTKPVEFEALVAEDDKGGYVAQAVFGIDRTEWGSVYGSGKFFARLGQHVVNDRVHLHLKVATKAG